MTLLSFFRPQIINIFHSPVNGEIKVTEFFGKKAIYVDGAPQTGAEIKPMWKKVIKTMKQCNNVTMKQCLVLGIGGGDVIQIVSQQYPGIIIHAAELDPVMTEIAEKYFGLDKIPNLKIYIDDAFKFIKKRSAGKFELIVVDLFLGKQNPTNSRGRAFLYGLKELISRDGVILYNSHFDEKNREEYKEFKKRCFEIFKSVEEVFAYRFNRVLSLG